MSYLSLARKYRPQKFDELVGQEHIATTLTNAVNMDRVAHAYLFAGPRGVGKTSAARILAKSLNCEKGPTPNPCQKCASCEEISKTISMDVIEIDGASNRGIDEIRNLRENIKFASIHGKFRIYIIDEIHMLTQDAFNALLKTLEEPPLHVKFIFATTQPYKVPPTVLSRCQCFDFRRIPIRDIIKKLEEIREKEKFELSDEALLLIAKQADGSMRDAEVILDQILSFTKGKVEPSDVVKVLGLLEHESLFDLANAIINNEKDKVLSIINELVNSGKDPIFITSSIIDYFRNLMVIKLVKDAFGSDLALSTEDYHKLQKQSQEFSLDEILYITYTLAAAMDLMKKTSLERIPLEISLIKLTERSRPASIKEILDRLIIIEKRLKEESFSIVASPQPEAYQPEAASSSEEINAVSEKITEEVKERPIPEKEVAAEKDILILQKIKDSWPKILNFLKNKKMSLATFLSEGVLVNVKDNALRIGFNKNNSLHKESLETNTNRKFIEEAIQAVVGDKVAINIETLSDSVGTVSMRTGPSRGSVVSGGDLSPSKLGALSSSSDKEISPIEPVVESALDIFDGKVVDIRRERQKEKE